MLEHLPRRLLHLEGLAVLTGAIVLYFDASYGWLLLLVLFLAPDLSMIGYLGGPRGRALTYDVVHMRTADRPRRRGRPRRIEPRDADRPDLGRAHRPGPPARLRAQVPDRFQGRTWRVWPESNSRHGRRRSRRCLASYRARITSSDRP